MPAWCHGLAYSPAHARYYVAATQLDKVVVYDEDFRLEGEILLSAKVSPDRHGFHHPNDLFVHGQSLFVSVFSVSGHWRQDVNDGAVLEIDLNSSRVAGPVVDGLWMPHNPMVFDDSLVVLDSFRGRLCRSGGRVVGQFSGFARGLAHDGRFFYVGQNRNRQYHKLPAGAACLSLDTAIVLFDERTKLSRSLPLPRGLTDVHSILVLESGGAAGCAQNAGRRGARFLSGQVRAPRLPVETGGAKEGRPDWFGRRRQAGADCKVAMKNCRRA